MMPDDKPKLLPGVREMPTEEGGIMRGNYVNTVYRMQGGREFCSSQIPHERMCDDWRVWQTAGEESCPR